MSTSRFKKHLNFCGVCNKAHGGNVNQDCFVTNLKNKTAWFEANNINFLGLERALGRVLRKLWFECITCDIFLVVAHKSGVELVTADMLSRVALGKYKQEFSKFEASAIESKYAVPKNIFNCIFSDKVTYDFTLFKYST